MAEKVKDVGWGHMDKQYNKKTAPSAFRFMFAANQGGALLETLPGQIIRILNFF